jgi:hypothetical protein
MKIEVSDEEGKLRQQADGLDQEIRRLNITVPVGLRELTPPTAEALAIDFYQRHIAASREVVQRHKDQRQSRELARKAGEDAEKERLDHQGETKDAIGYYKPIPGTLSYVLLLANDSEPQRRAIVDRIRRIRSYGAIKRVIRVDPGGHGLSQRIQYVPAEEGKSAQLDLIGVVFAVRNGFAVDEKNRVEQRMTEQGHAERVREEQEEEARWAAYANNN